jgi:hypothetical protein
MAVEVKVPVSKESYELMQGIAGFLKVVKTALKDGWQPGSDIPAVMVGAMATLVPAMQGVEKLPVEIVAEMPEFAAAVMLGAVDVFKAVRS